MTIKFADGKIYILGSFSICITLDQFSAGFSVKLLLQRMDTNFDNCVNLKNVHGNFSNSSNIAFESRRTSWGEGPDVLVVFNNSTSVSANIIEYRVAFNPFAVFCFLN